MTSTEEALETLTFDPRQSFEPTRLFWKQATRERGHIATLEDTVSANGSINLWLENPSGTGVTAFVTTLHAASLGAASVSAYDSFDTEPSGGSSLSIDNLLLDKSGAIDGGNLSAASGASYTANGAHSGTVIGGGQGAGSIGDTGDVFAFAMEPDRDLVVELRDESGADQKAVISIVYFELDEVISESPTVEP